VRRRVLRQGQSRRRTARNSRRLGDLRCVGVPRRRSRHAGALQTVPSSPDAVVSGPAPRMARIGRRRRASEVRARTSASVRAGGRAGVSRPRRRREPVRVRPHEQLERRLPIASRCGITCALDDGLTDSVGHCTPTIAELSNEVEPAPGRNRGSYRRNGLAHAYGLPDHNPTANEETHAERNNQLSRTGIRGERSARTRAAHQPRHCRRLPTATRGTGACRPLPAVRYHKRGWGGSTDTPPPVSVADHAADAPALLDHLGSATRPHRRPPTWRSGRRAADARPPRATRTHSCGWSRR
jgi:hypothetical protein